jgi:hypothetical protein
VRCLTRTLFDIITTFKPLINQKYILDFKLSPCFTCNMFSFGCILLPKKMELIEGSETSAISNQTPGKHPKKNILQKYIVIAFGLSGCWRAEDCFWLPQFRNNLSVPSSRIRKTQLLDRCSRNIGKPRRETSQKSGGLSYIAALSCSIECLQI